MSFTGTSLEDRIAEELLTRSTIVTRPVNEFSYMPGPAEVGYGPIAFGDWRSAHHC